MELRDMVLDSWSFRHCICCKKEREEGERYAARMEVKYCYYRKSGSGMRTQYNNKKSDNTYSTSRSHLERATSILLALHSSVCNLLNIFEVVRQIFLGQDRWFLNKFQSISISSVIILIHFVSHCNPYCPTDLSFCYISNPI